MAASSFCSESGSGRSGRQSSTSWSKHLLSKQRREKSASRIEVRRSGVHGRGVFAKDRIRKGAKIIEYTGRHIGWKEAQELPPLDPKNPYHTLLFSLDNGDVIDASVGGNEARWINHSCDPNCETFEQDDRIFVHDSAGFWPQAKNFSTTTK